MSALERALLSESVAGTGHSRRDPLRVAIRVAPPRRPSRRRPELAGRGLESLDRGRPAPRLLRPSRQP